MIHHTQRGRGGTGTAPLAWALALAATVWAVLAGASPAHAVTPAPAPSQKVGQPFAVNTDGIACYRIPSIISVPNPQHPKELLAFAEGRVDNCGDVGDVDLVMKRSDDGGISWDDYPLQRLRGVNDCGEFQNIVPMVHVPPNGSTDPVRITVMFAYNTVGADCDGTLTRGPRTLHSIFSTDYGVNWSSGSFIDGVPPSPTAPATPLWSWVSTGPGHAIELRHGPHAGRMVVAGDHTPADDSTPGDGIVKQPGIQLYYSDDGGADWTRGAVWDPPAGQWGAGEPTLAERADGSVYVNARGNKVCETHDLRLAGVSQDGGVSFVNGDDAFTPVPDLVSPPVSGSLLTVSDPGANGAGRMLFSGPSRAGSESGDRQAMSIRTSTDEGATWTTSGTLINKGRTGYSDLTLMSSGQIGLVYETATNTPHSNVYFTSFTTQQLDDNTEELIQQTSDGTGNGDNGVVNGKATLTTRGSHPALNLDGVDDYVRIVNCPRNLRLGASDFTVAAWINYTGTSGYDPIVWGYGQDAAPQFWLRADPAGGRITGAITTAPDPQHGTPGGTFAVSTASAYNDGGWHYVVFRRQAGQLLLSVDGGTAVSATAEAGSSINASETYATPADAFTLHIGARPDLAQLFKGAMDDVRVYDRSLTTDEIALIKNGATTVPDEQVRLAFTTIW
ncbi:LamG-like jellyroll fold domain-containing protein [Streptomyces polygonati]|uniref:exo-alpha-sialidase n=1 Tax=Streptomyces polygonati TaxID=1617087 RepID=A0ABV8HDG0_9ACTN